MAGMTDNWKKFSEAFKPKTSDRIAAPKKDKPPTSSRVDKKQTGMTGGRSKVKSKLSARELEDSTFPFWSAAQTVLKEELSRLDKNYYIVDISMPNSGTLMHYSNNGGILTFLALNSIYTDDIDEFKQQIQQIRLPDSIDLVYLWDAFLVYPQEYITTLLDTLLPLVNKGGQISFITLTSNTGPTEPGIFAFDSEEDAIYWKNLKAAPTQPSLPSNREIAAMLPNCEPKKLALMDLGYQDNLYIKLTDR